MPNSPQNVKNSNTKSRICDFCTKSVAVVYCKPDSAKLCLSCDKQVHSTNQLFTKHIRFRLCDFCDSSAATIYCCTDNSVLCQNCDYEVHNNGPKSDVVTHDRRPLEGFTGRPSVVEMAVAVGFEGFDLKSLLNGDDKGVCGDDGLLSGFEDGNDDGLFDFFVWDSPGIVNLDELIVSTDRSHSFQAMVVPPLPKDRNLSCGQHKQEILRQLCELAKLEPITNQDSVPLVNNHFEADKNQDFKIQHQEQAYQHDGRHPILKGDEARTYSWGDEGMNSGNDVFLSPWLSQINFEEVGLNSDTKSGICSSVNNDATECNSQLAIGADSTSVPQKVSSYEFTAADRVSAVSRYKEKKRTRRFEKHIRYESRKVQAENRTRIKGRFAKMESRAA